MSFLFLRIYRERRRQGKACRLLLRPFSSLTSPSTLPTPRARYFLFPFAYAASGGGRVEKKGRAAEATRPEHLQGGTKHPAETPPGARKPNAFQERGQTQHAERIHFSHKDIQTNTTTGRAPEEDAAGPTTSPKPAKPTTSGRDTSRAAEGAAAGKERAGTRGRTHNKDAHWFCRGAGQRASGRPAARHNKGKEEPNGNSLPVWAGRRNLAARWHALAAMKRS